MLEFELTLRGYRKDDVEAMYALDIACFEEPFRFSRAMIRHSAEIAPARVVVAEQRQRLVGFAILHVETFRQGHIGYIVTIDVAESVRRHGVAQRMMEQMEREAGAAGCGAVLLHVFTGNEGAIRFYERLGFTRVGRAPGFYRPDLDAWVYRKELSSPQGGGEAEP